MCGLPTGSGLIACIVFPFSTAMESCWSMPRFLLVCHAKSVAWTNCVIFSGLIIWATVLRYFSCLASLDGPLVTNSLFSQTCLITCICSGLGVLRKPPLPSRVEREETFNTPLWGGFWQDTDVQRDLLHSGSTHSSSRGECQHSGPGRSGEGRKNQTPTTSEPIDNHVIPHQPRHAPPPRSSHSSSSSSSSSGGMGWHLSMPGVYTTTPSFFPCRPHQNQLSAAKERQKQDPTPFSNKRNNTRTLHLNPPQHPLGCHDEPWYHLKHGLLVVWAII
jgi:hypothetical protein